MLKVSVPKPTRGNILPGIYGPTGDLHFPFLHGIEISLLIMQVPRDATCHARSVTCYNSTTVAVGEAASWRHIFVRFAMVVSFWCHLSAHGT